jgi:hypothetical protein
MVYRSRAHVNVLASTPQPTDHFQVYVQASREDQVVVHPSSTLVGGLTAKKRRHLMKLQETTSLKKE